MMDDKLKIAFFDKFFGDDNKKNLDSINTSVDPKWANECTELYKTSKTAMDLTVLKQMLQTESVSFQFSELKDWMNKTLLNVNFNNIRVCFGVYNKDVITIENKPTKLSKGKLTVFLWPYLDDKKATRPKQGFVTDVEEEEVEPFNIGSLHP